YINGGSFHTTRTKYPTELRTQGWGVCCGWEPEYVRALASKPEGTTDIQHAANQLVARAIQNLGKDADQVSAGDKRALAKLAREAIEEKKLKEGKLGTLRYRLGVYHYESYWEVDERGRTQRIPAGSQSPIVAVKTESE